ncbi:MAG: HDOD domain-containing protein [Pseudomonadota bacterium]
MEHPLPKQIGRFKVHKILGKGVQGTVYLAEDTHLKRLVAIKTLQISGPAEGRASRVRSLLDEALISGKLQHPNVVTLYDAGEEGNTPFLVFEYVKGTPLSNLILQEGRLDREQAVKITIQVLDALQFAHQNQVVHRDIKPSNILVTENGTARVMDFGIAQHFSTAAAGNEKLFGTPSYMAPEYIEQKIFRPSADVFAASMVLYEMLTGSPAACCETATQTLHKILNAEFTPPSDNNADVDQKLDQIVLKALSKRPEARHGSAEKLADALRGYLDPEVDLHQSSETRQAVLEFLMRRMRTKSDFPMMSSTMSAVNKATSSDGTAVTELAEVIMKDFALTNKLLKLVNSSSYSQYGGRIRTVSRAIIVLGVQALRNIASSLALYGHLQNKTIASHLKDQAIASYFSSLFAREISQRSGIGDPEEAYLCAMFHNLGKLLATFYFHEEMLEIKHLMRQKNLDEETASAAILGISYEELGVGVARSWNLPGKIINSMTRIERGKSKQALLQEDKLRVLAEFACETCNIICTAPPDKQLAMLAETTNRYAPVTDLSPQDTIGLAGETIKRLLGEIAVLGFETQRSELCDRLRNWGESLTTQAPAGELSDVTQQIVFAAGDSLITRSPYDYPAGNETAKQQAALSMGVQELANILTGEFELNDALRIILETLYRSIGFTRVMIAFHEPAKNTLKCRFGFGPVIDPMLGPFSIPVEKQQGVFYAAVTKGVDILIKDVNADSIRNFIPQDYRRFFPAETFILLPVVVNKKTVGVLYCDKDEANSIDLPPECLSLVKALRNQAVLAIKLKG